MNCDICYEPITVPSASYCACKNAHRHVHCLQQWIAYQSPYRTHCEICKQRYQYLVVLVSPQQPPASSCVPPRRLIWLTVRDSFIAMLILMDFYVTLGMALSYIPGAREVLFHGDMWPTVFVLGIFASHVLLSIGLLCKYGLELPEPTERRLVIVICCIWVLCFLPLSFIILFHKIYLRARREYLAEIYGD